MGCGGSRLSSGGEAPPTAKLRPLIRRRIEDIRRLKISESLAGGTLSKKELLKHGVEDDETHSVGDNSHKNVSSPEESVTSPKTPPPAISKVAPEPQEPITKETSNSEEEEKVWETEEEEEEDEEVEGGIGNENGYMFPGSPSFRVYCIESIVSSDDESEKIVAIIHAGDNDVTKQELIQNADSVKVIESVHCTEDKATKLKKKGKKGMKFRKGQAAVRNLLNVKSCYNPACSSHDKTHLLTAKAAA